MPQVIAAVVTTGTSGAHRRAPNVEAMTTIIEGMTTVIEARSLTKRYGDLVAVDHLDLAVSAGERVAILGPNGAGKTTTIELLLGMRRPTAGSVSVFGADPGAAATRARTGAMLQDTDVPEGLTVTETIDLVRHYYPVALPLDEVLSRADLLEKRSSRVSQLSGGQRQRLSFALAICGDPDLLFLDEPTAALDVEARHTFWEQVRGLADLGKTVLFSTHNLAEADALAERVIVISRGRVLVDGTPAHIKSLVAGATVDLSTDAPLATLAALPGVLSALPAPDRAGATDGLVGIRVMSSAPEELLRHLFQQGYAVAGLRVTEADLETAFLHLVAADSTPTLASQPMESLR